MAQVVIENPILNSPFGEPARFHEFDKYGTPTGRILDGRRKSGYFIPVAQPRRQAVQPDLFEEEPRENDDINYVRSRVALWRDRQYPGVSPVTRQLLNHWRDPRRERRLYFCQVEAAETLTGGQAARLRRAGAASPRAATQVWRRAIKFREALFRVLNAKAQGGAVAREDLSNIEAEHARAVSFARLSRTGEGYAWSLDPSASALEAAMQPLVESAVSLLTSAKLERLGRCGRSTCTWLFMDETRNHSRRWCEMASCGNVIKVRRFREKARGAGR